MQNRVIARRGLRSGLVAAGLVVGIVALGTASAQAATASTSVPGSAAVSTSNDTPYSNPAPLGNKSLSELQVIAANNRAAQPAATYAYPHCNNATQVALKSQPTEHGGIPSYATTNYDCILERGNVNNGVTWLQYSLAYCYQQNIAVDGSFGNATYNALLQVQRQLGITVDGVYGPGSRNAMLHDSSAYCHPLTDFVGF